MSEQGSDVGAELNRLRLEYFGLRKRVAELEAALFTLACSEEMLRGVHPTADPRWEILRCAAERARALLAPREPIDIKPEDEAAVRAIFEPKPCGTCEGSKEVRVHEPGCRYRDDPALRGLMYAFNLDGSCEWCYPAKEPCPDCAQKSSGVVTYPCRRCGEAEDRRGAPCPECRGGEER